ncbi:hypothetical protein FRB97_001510 [Tulasnella sp. 331]|nr:hypothetical protein FRB97_001510 [Tulasnella sp. 331]KAG8870467.1 hypothetical protein FRB98_001597 [Tulasnella sp. 332]
MSISVALNSPNPAMDSSPSVAVTVSNVGGSGARDSSVANGGTIHIFQPDPQFFTPPIAVLPVADASSQAQFGATPSQLASFDWTVQTEGWAFSPRSGKKANTIQGGNATFATLEMAYPYILLTLADATKIFSIVKGAQEYNVSSTATTSLGASVYQDTDAISWSVPCSTVAQMSVTFTFQGVTIPVQSNALYTNIGGDCVSNIKGWADSNRTTYILGSTFMSSAYITYTAFSNSAQTNQIGFANRQTASKSSPNTGAIVGGVIGGIVLLLFVGRGAFNFGRQRGRTEAPSSTYLSTVRTPLEDKVGSVFRWLDRKKDYNDDNTEAGPRTTGTVTGGVSTNEDIRSVEHAYGENHDVVVMPWAPSAAEEVAFLSPTGRSFDHHGNVLDRDPLRQHSQTPFTMTTTETPPAPSPDRFSAGEYDRRRLYDPRGQNVMTHSGYSSVPTSSLSGQTSTGPVMWVERTGR